MYQVFVDFFNYFTKNPKNMFQKTINAFIFTFLFFNFLNAQNLLNHGYNHGTLPTNINTNDVISAYTTWKSSFTESCGDDRIRVKFDEPNQTVSEGIGYGMLIAAYIGDQDLLDGLWNYYTDFLNENDVMNWKINGCSSVANDGRNGATDAELDAAMALIIASHRWGNTGIINYDTAASNLITTIKDHEIESGTNVLKPGDAWGGTNTTNISYYAPGYYRAYEAHTNDTSWQNVASKSYEIINANLNYTGAAYNLVSDWCKADGTFANEVDWAFAQGKKYNYDAARTPWRIVMDYLWSGNSDALSYSNKCIAFINAQNGLDNIRPGYNLDGSAFEFGYYDVTFTGAYATAAMASNDQNFVNTAYSKVVDMPTDAYFGSTLRVLYLLTLSGNFYSPEQFATSLSTNDTVLLKEYPTYPNPAKNSLHITFEKTHNNTLKVYNTNGKLLINKIFEDKNADLNIEQLTKGFYIISLNNKIHKLIKE